MEGERKEKKGFQPTIPVRVGRLASTTDAPSIATPITGDSMRGLIASPTPSLSSLPSLSSTHTPSLSSHTHPINPSAATIAAAPNAAAAKPKFAPTIPARRKKPQDDSPLVPDDVVLEQERKPREPRQPKDRDPTKRKPQDMAPVKVAFMGQSQGITKKSGGVGIVRGPSQTDPIPGAKDYGNQSQARVKSESGAAEVQEISDDAKPGLKVEESDPTAHTFRPVFFGADRIAEPRTNIKPDEEKTTESAKPFKEGSVYFFQMPTALPSKTIAQQPFYQTFEPPSNVEYTATSIEHRPLNNLTQFPAGMMGKLKVYRSGRMMMKIGDISYDVTPGSSVHFFQKAVAISTEARQAIDIGPVEDRYVCIPDLDQLIIQ
eukprot:TRINITY_DN4520_c0_g6_i2.p1 TRINITY_DN4520_c0_g6~~TRINITY_DN4520_c0_g6_i2.p1  ORF type:complete len:375 (+),score=77.74 TRINITY_DN4520_c0_g6_i2:80-1204(+)